MLSSRREYRFSNSTGCADSLAGDIAEVLGGSGHRILALSGGRTPETVLPLLASKPIYWSRISVTLTDDRCVDEDSAASNAGLVRRCLLKKGADKARFHPLWRDDRPEDPWATRDLAGPIDAVYLGMGPDGHIASLFPAPDARLFDGPGHVIRTEAPTPPTRRISLTLPAILSARHIFLQLGGAEKRDTYEHATDKATPELPVSLLLHAGHPSLRVYIDES